MRWLFLARNYHTNTTEKKDFGDMTRMKKMPEFINDRLIYDISVRIKNTTLRLKQARFTSLESIVIKSLNGVALRINRIP